MPVLGTGIGVAVVISCISTAIFIIHRRSQNQQNGEILEIPSSNQK